MWKLQFMPNCVLRLNICYCQRYWMDCYWKWMKLQKVWLNVDIIHENVMITLEMCYVIVVIGKKEHLREGRGRGRERERESMLCMYCWMKRERDGMLCMYCWMKRERACHRKNEIERAMDGETMLLVIWSWMYTEQAGDAEWSVCVCVYVCVWVKLMNYTWNGLCLKEGHARKMTVWQL